MTLFKDARARTLRANESIEVLKIEIKEFNRKRPYSIQNEIDIEKKEILLVYEPTAQIPPSREISAAYLV